MNVNWFKDPNNIVYAKVEEFVPVFAKETGISDLGDQIEKFRDNPTKEGILLKGKKRTSLKLLIPNLLFEEKLPMGENVWVYLGENYECYALYWDMEEV